MYMCNCAYITTGMVRTVFVYQLHVQDSIFRYGAYFSNTVNRQLILVAENFTQL